MIRLVLLLCCAILAVQSLAGRGADWSEAAVSRTAATASGATAEARGSASGVRFAPVARSEVSEPALERAGGHDAPVGRAPVAEAATHVVTGSVVNMRAGPSTGDRVVGQMAEGQPAELLAQTGGGWAEIRALRSGREGYMAARFLAPVQ